jgi:hypothetical protein
MYGKTSPMYGKARTEGAGRPSLFDRKISVFDFNTETYTSYNSIREAAIALNVNVCSINKNLKVKNLIKVNIFLNYYNF